MTYGQENEFALVNISTTELSSSLNSNERELVGPGYGDLYWGQWELFLWEIYANRTTYSDGTIIYSDPIIYSGIDYSDDVLVSRQYAPEPWLQQNPNINTTLYDDSSIVQPYKTNSVIQGGTGYYESTHQITETSHISRSITLKLSYSTKVMLRLQETEVKIHFDAQYKYDETHTNSIKTFYHIEDDDSSDLFHYDVGTDLRFGVPIFRNTPNESPTNQSKSSNPWEYGTRDYLPPETTYPAITLNTDGDAYSPSEGDTPLVELTITDEANLSVVLLIYSHDGGEHWNTINMVERLNDPNSWYCNIPSHEHGTEVLWYIFASDTNGNSKTVYNIDDDYFSYIVVNRPPTVELLAPNGGETYQNSILIEWTGSDPDDDSVIYKLAYQLSGGAWILVVQNLINTSYVWDISNIADCQTVSVRVYADDGYGYIVFDTSDFAFSIDNDDIPSAAFLSPHTGYTCTGTITITWLKEDPDDYITGYQLYYSITSGSPAWIAIDEDIAANILTYEWNTSSIIHSTNARLKIIVLNLLDEPVETITGLFIIDNRPTIQMNLINPNGGEIIYQNCTISWNVAYSNPLITYEIQLEYSFDSVTWFTIAAGINGTSYFWDTSTLADGTNYRVKIILTASYLGVALDPIVDISEMTFTINNTSPTTDINMPIIAAIVALLSIGLLSTVKKLKKRK